MNQKEFQQYWQQQYGDCLPIGYKLRQQFEEYWLRIHTLPQSQRYAEVAAEYQEILKRHNTILTDLLNDSGKYILVTTGYSETAKPIYSYDDLNRLVSNREYWRSVSMDNINGTIGYWHFFISERIWESSSMDEILKLVADDIISNVLFVGIEQNCIYHPYDGGGDIITKTPSLKQSLKTIYSTWLSQHPEGL